MMLAFFFAALLGAQQVPVPQPFPRPGTPPPPAAPAQVAPPATAPPPKTAATPPPANAQAPPTEAMLGLPIYPAAQFIGSYDAGRGQRFYLFGSAAPYTDLVAYYRTSLKQKGEVVFEAPATYSFEVGKYREETMAFPPGVTIKDFQSAISEGFPNPKPGGQPARFRSIIQFVAVTEK
jgi:hypothetical protein